MRSATFAIGTACAVFATMLAVGCASGTRSSAPSTAPRHSRPPLVINHPRLERPRLDRGQLKRGVGWSSPTQIAFTTSGSSDCYWIPTRLTVLTRHRIRIDMGMTHDKGGGCLLNLVSFPIGVRIRSGLVDSHRPLTVRLAYETHYSGEGTRRWHRTFVAPPFRATT